ncbi:tyrosine-type recombinase/integrase [Inhella gelatinilytica]|uniref:Tyrosine-type recombinase/integrase n=1 Tax=Inhella gelatinilytica TaxID=2795030 RepID=A0A931IXY0_9BURK|nr:tyrosine-type recombinase/integrase [Inhella gelatinilytica]MBH9553947.1 tyrosine-type recombinase/integrase [Inhella gelatinilytica]
MNTSYNLLHEAGFRCYRDRGDVDHLRYTGQTRKRANRFAAAQSLLLRTASSPGVFAGRLVCLDLVRPSELVDVLSAPTYRLGDHQCTDWHSRCGRRIDRRALSSFTTMALEQRCIDVPLEIAALQSLLAEVPAYSEFPEAQRLVELERDLVCWAGQRLPRSLWAHVSGLSPMSALPREMAALADCVGVPRISVDEAALGRSAEMADMLDTAVSAGRDSTTPLLVELGMKVFSIPAKESEQQTLRRWAAELLALRGQVEAGDVTSAVVIAWQFDLVESGTLTDINAALATRARYSRTASLRLWRMLAPLGPDVQRWSTASLSAGYLSMMSDPSCKDLRGLGAAISSFQAFLQEVFGIPTSPLGLHKHIPEPTPRVQWIPESAVLRAIRWLDEDTKGDPRLKEICALKILMAHAAPFRLDELRWLRLSNIFPLADGSIEVEITPIAGVHRLKTAAAQRRVLISDPVVVCRLRALIARREAEGAPSNGLLFAAAGEDTAPYRRRAVHIALLRLLKQATGNPSMTFHALRHTVISNAMEELLSSAAVTNNNRLTQLADWVGHEVAVTTLRFYTHRYEVALRMQIDACLRGVGLTNADGERLLGIKANTLTAGARRKRVPMEVHLWHLASSRAQALVRELPNAATGLDLHEPEPTSFIGSVATHFTAQKCLAVLGCLTTNLDPRLIEGRMQLRSSELISIDKAAVCVARDLYAARSALAPVEWSGARSVIKHLGLNFGRVVQPRYAKLVKAMSLPMDTNLAAAAAKTWISAWWDGQLNADPPERLVPLLGFLKEAGITLDALQLTYENDGSDPVGVAELLARAAHVAAAVFHGHWSTKPLGRSRRGRSRAYLIWPSRADADAAGRSNAGFDALMFALAVWVHPEVQGRH